MTETFYIEVGYTNQRPLVPDEHTAWVIVATDQGLTEAQLIAAQMVGGLCTMATSTRLLYVEI